MWKFTLNAEKSYIFLWAVTVMLIAKITISQGVKCAKSETNWTLMFIDISNRNFAGPRNPPKWVPNHDPHGYKWLTQHLFIQSFCFFSDTETTEYGDIECLSPPPYVPPVRYTYSYKFNWRL